MFKFKNPHFKDTLQNINPLISQPLKCFPHFTETSSDTDFVHFPEEENW